MSVSPLPVRNRPQISEEAFQAWLDDPVTQWVLAACRKAAEENRQVWEEESWGKGKPDQALLIELRTRADAYMALAETRYSGWLKTHGEDE